MDRTAVSITITVALAIVALIAGIILLVEQNQKHDIQRMTACVDSGGQWLPARGQTGVFQCEKAVTLP